MTSPTPALGIDPRAPWVVFRDKSLQARINRARSWLRNVGRPYPPIETVRRRALLELRRNPTITTYKFKGGNEVRRRPGDPWARFQEILESGIRSLRAVGLFGESGDV